jgi:hypothetical protein
MTSTAPAGCVAELIAVRAGRGDDQRRGTLLAAWGARRKSKSTP